MQQKTTNDQTMMQMNQQVYQNQQVGNFNNMGYNSLSTTPYQSMPSTQEKSMVQQQLQELYTLPPTSETQEKIHRLQERLNAIQQLETNDGMGGTMIDSPQVSSTTGRGRSRGNSSKPRKPRQKKSEKQSQALATDEESVVPSNLPVSEDSVTAGTGLSDLSQIYSEDHEMADLSQDNSIGDLDTSTDASGKKIKKPRKPRAPKTPKEPKSPKESKEKKKKEKDPEKSSKKKKSKKVSDGDNSVSHDNNSTELSKQTSEGEENQTLASLMHNQNSTDANSGDALEGETTKTDDAKADEVTDFDDIPGSKIPNKSNSDEKSEDDGKSDDQNSMNEEDSPTKKKRSKSRKNAFATKSNRSKGKLGGGKSRRSGRMKIVQDSGDEGGDDLITTPPASPHGEDTEIDSSKRRSARNTQRKKYVDDVMLRFSDDDGGLLSPVKRESKEEKKEKVEGEASTSVSTSQASEIKTEAPEVKPVEEPNNKVNYVYINTNEEDTMIVQFVLAQRMGKREVKKVEPIKEEEKKEEVVEEKKTDDVEGDVEKKEDSEVKTEDVVEKMEVDNEETTETKETEEKVDESQEKEEKSDEKSDEVENDVENEKDSTEVEKTKDEISTEPEKTENVDSKEEEEQKEEDTKMETSDETATEEAPSTDTKTDEKTEESTEESSEKKADDEEEKKAVEEKPAEEPEYVEVEEYFVKYRNFSYLHCEWRTEDELLKGDKRVSNKIRRFQQKQGQQFNIFENLEEEPFNPDFTEVDRVLDCSEHTDDDGNTVKHYLVKWKSLPYEDATWELEEDVDEQKIEQYLKFNKVPPKSEWKFKKRPHPDQWKELDKTPIFKGGNTLRPYQLEGLNWLRYSWYKGNNCILADEMGLGKTIQSLTFVNSVFEFGIRGPFLVIAPLSTIPNWQREFEGWTELNVIVYHGSATSRQMLQDYEVFYKLDNGKQLKEITKFNVLITTFEMIVTDYQDLSNFNFRACVIDEAHRLKNRNCKLLEGLRQLHLEHRVLLSGTPLQNNISELFSLLNFLEPSQFSNNEEFLREFGSLKTEDEVTKLQALLKPMMLRRLKDDVEKSLAPKEETIVEVELTNIQKKYYRGILEQNFSFLQKGTTAANIPNLMNTMMELRKCCIHPYLLNGAEDQIQYEWRLSHGEDKDSYFKNIVNASGKMVLIDKLLPKLKANGHRVLIFSQMVRCLDILEDYLVFKKYPFERIDGRIRGNLRQAAIDRYSKPDSDRFVFLLCTKAGGLGINLTAADTVIIYDSDWNPQNDLQAQARCHRIGQQKMVKIYRLLCRGTYEREMFDKASMKLGLDKAILQSMNTGMAAGKDGSGKQLTKKEIEDLLKKGAYGAVMDDDNAGDKFCEEDIDSILERRTLTIVMESEKGSTFSKASFASSNNRSDINIDDPDFWGKWAKKAEIDTTIGEKDETEDLVLSEPRRRTQIKRYGHDEGVMDMSEDSTGLETDEEGGIGANLRSKGRRARDKLRRGAKLPDDYMPRDRDSHGFDDVSYGSWARSECFKVEKGLLSFG
jgi:chromodomain-helicase-DNA-binding protein 7